MKRVVPAVLLCLFAVSGVARADGTAPPFASDASTRILWQQVLASPKDDWVNHLLRLKEGTFLASGFVGRDDKAKGSDWHALAAKLTLDGRLVWRREFGEGGGADAFWASAEGTDGRLHTAGFTARIGNGGLDAYLALLDSDGTMIRERAVGGPGYDRVTDIAPATDGGFVAAGFSTVEGKQRQILIVKSDAENREVWRRLYGGPKDDDALYIKPTLDGGFVIAGGTDESGDGDVLVMRLDADGQELWRKVIGAPGGLDVPHSLSLHKDGRIQVVGYTESWGSREHDLLAITLRPDGKVLRHEVFGGAGDDRAMVSAIDDKDRTWITGYTTSAGAGGYDIFVAQLQSDGSFAERLATIGGPADDNGTVILPLNDGTLLLGAYSANLGQGGQDGVVLRIAEPAWPEAPKGFLRRRIDSH